jgi:hypothetical protein
MVLCKGLARLGQGNTLAAAAPGHGEVALEAKPVALEHGWAHRVLIRLTAEGD